MPYKTVVDNETFVICWQQSRSAEEVADKTGMAVNSVYVKANRLRAKGVPLKKFKYGGSEAIDYKGLAALAQELGEDTP